MKIEALGSIKSNGYVLDQEDVKTVPDEIGEQWVKRGWAKDIAGVIPTGERVILNAKLAVDPVKTVIAAKNVGVQ